MHLRSYWSFHLSRRACINDTMGNRYDAKKYLVLFVPFTFTVFMEEFPYKPKVEIIKYEL